MKDAYDEINLHLINNNFIQGFTHENFMKMKNTIKLILGIKESRDSYYIIETKQFVNKNINDNYKPVYITKDEISNIRCAINKISSINMYPSIPRYFCFIDGDKLIVKLFSIFFNFDGVNDYSKNKFLDNYEVIATNSKALITKILTGGYVNMNSLTLNNTFDFIKYVQKKEIKYYYDNFNTIEDVKKYLIETSDCCVDKYCNVINDENFMSKYINNDTEYMKQLNELKSVLRNLLLIENKFTYQEIYDLHHIEEIRRTYTWIFMSLSDKMNEYIYYADNIPILTRCIYVSCFMDKIYGYWNFTNTHKRNFIKNILLKEFYDEHSIILYQLIMNMYNVMYDYKNKNNDMLKLNNDGTFSDLPDYDERFDEYGRE